MFDALSWLGWSLVNIDEPGKGRNSRLPGQKALRFGDSGDPRRVRQTDGVHRSRGAFPAQCEVCFPQITTPPTNP
jgi:hypothetical protein